MSNKNKKHNRKLFLAGLATTTVAVSAVTPASAATHFMDFGPGQSGYEATMALVKQQIIFGYGDKTFRPYEHISREHVATILVNAKKLQTPPNFSEIISHYRDVDESMVYAKQIAAVTHEGIFKGAHGYFAPNTSITREQTATILVKAFHLEPTDTPVAFVDMKKVDGSHRENVKVLAQHGISIGILNQAGDRYFDPQAPITRAQFASLLYNTMRVASGEVLTSAPVAKNVVISGTEKVGSTLTSSYNYYDEDGDKEGKTRYQWYRSDTSSGDKKEAIDGANALGYTLTAADEGKYVTFEVTPVAKTGNQLEGKPAQSATTGKITAKSGNAPIAKNVLMKGSENVGETLSVSYDFSDADDDAEGKSLYQWYRSDHAAGTNAEAITGANNKSYKLTADDEGKFISFKVIPVAATGTPKEGEAVVVKSSGSIGPSNGKAPAVSGLQIDGPEIVGGELKATYTFSDADGDAEGASKYQWYRADNVSGKNQVAISGATSKSYKLTTADEGKYISFSVTPVSKTGEPSEGEKISAGTKGLISAAQGSAPVAKEVSITGAYTVGAKLTGSFDFYDADGDAEQGTTFQWYRSVSPNGAKETIDGATKETYTLQPEDEGKYIWFEVTPRTATGKEKEGSPASEVTSVAISPAVIDHAPTASNVQIDKDNHPVVGDTLTASYQFADVDGNKEGASIYQWYRDGKQIDGANSLTYTLTKEDEGKNITFKVTPVSATGKNNIGDTVGKETAKVQAADGVAPKANDLSINGTHTVGGTLTGHYTFGDADGDEEGVSTYQWYRADADDVKGENKTVIKGATDQAYTLTTKDEGKYIWFEVTPVSKTGTNKTGEAASVASSKTIDAANGSAPTAKNIQVTGIPTVGKTLKATYEYVDADGDKEAGSVFQWYRGEEAIPGANDLEYTLTRADEGKQIRFSVTPKTATGDVKEGTETFSANTNAVSPKAGDAPVADKLVMEGALQVGATVTGYYEFSDADDDEEGNSIYQWYRAEDANDKNPEHIQGANEKSYTLTADDEGKYLIFKVTPVAKTGTPKEGETQHVYSNGAVAAAKSSAPVAQDVTIEGAGSPVVGNELKGQYKYLDADGDKESGTTFQWYRDGKPIEGATKQTYTLTNKDEGKVITFKVTPKAATGDVTVGKTVEAFTSEVQAAEGSAPTVSNVSITGALSVGQALTGTYIYNDADDDLEGVSIYQWYRDGSPITGANAKTYKLTEADKGHTISFEVTPVAKTGSPKEGQPVKVKSSSTVKEVGIALDHYIVSEATANDGSISDTLEITITGGTFKEDVVEGVEVNHLPDGLRKHVTRDSDTTLTISFSGQAKHHSDNDDVHDASITISKEYVNNASENIRSGNFTFDFAGPDKTAPELVVSEITPGDKAGELDLLVGLNEPGKVYYVVQPAGESAPSVEQVKAGENSKDEEAVGAGTIDYVDVNDNQFRTITGLNPGKGYDFYFVTEDVHDNTSSIVAKTNITATIEVDKTELQSAIDEAQEKVEAAEPGAADGNYPEEAITALEDAIAAARAVADDKDATEEEVEKAIDRLNTAVDKFNASKVVVVKDALGTAITLASVLNEKNYTKDSWGNLVSALDEADRVNNDSNVSQEDVNEAYAALNDAIQNLENETPPTIDKVDLILAISNAQAAVDGATIGNVHGDYPKSAVTALKEAIGKARATFNKNDVTQDEVDKAVADLQTAMDVFNAAKVVVDKTALGITIDQAEPLEKDDYEADGWEVLQQALTKAKDVESEPAVTQAQIDLARANLRAAIRNLKPSEDINKIYLGIAIDSAEKKYDEAETGDTDGKYPEAAKENLNDAIQVAEAVFEDPSSQLDVDLAITTLEKAVEKFEAQVVKVDRTGLGTAIAYAKQLDESKYEIDSWKALQTALADAMDLVDSADASQADLDEAQHNLNAAINDLVLDDTPAVNKLDLSYSIFAAKDKAKNAVAGNEEGNYPQSAIDELNDAIKTAEDVVNKEDSTQLDVNLAKRTLEKAVENFYGQVVTVDRTALGNTIDLGRSLIQSNYTSETWSALQTALIDAENVETKAAVTQEEVDGAHATLSDAIRGLKLADTENVSTTDLLLTIYKAQDKLDRATIGAANGNYPKEAVEALQTAVDNAKAAANNSEAKQSVVDDAEKELSEAIAAFDKQVVKVDKTGLQTALAFANTLDKANYTEGTWAALSTALSEANEVDSNKGASQKEVNTVLSNLNEAIKGLELKETEKANTVDLLLVIYKAQDKLDRATIGEADGNYSEKAVKVLEKAITDAKAVVTDSDVDQDTINDAEKTLKDAIAAFEKEVVKVDKTGLQSVLAFTSTLTEDNYTSESWKALQEKVSTAKSVNNDTKAAQSQVSEATAALNTAIEGLERADKVNTGKLLHTIYNAQNKVDHAMPDKDYPADAIDVLKAAIEEAQDVAGNSSATQDEVDHAFTALNNAIETFENAKIVDEGEAPEVDTKNVTNTELGLTAETVTTSDNAVAEVDKTAEGVTITAVGAGDVTITVKDSKGNEATISVTVADDLSITKADVTPYEDEDQAPTIAGVSNNTIGLSKVDSWDPLSGITVSDDVDDLTTSDINVSYLNVSTNEAMSLDEAKVYLKAAAGNQVKVMYNLADKKGHPASANAIFTSKDDVNTISLTSASVGYLPQYNKLEIKGITGYEGGSTFDFTKITYTNGQGPVALSGGTYTVANGEEPDGPQQYLIEKETDGTYTLHLQVSDADANSIEYAEDYNPGGDIFEDTITLADGWNTDENGNQAVKVVNISTSVQP
ncbi:S-layer homology domain-containing protein [Virgibacillus sp. FSP13]